MIYMHIFPLKNNCLYDLLLEKIIIFDFLNLKVAYQLKCVYRSIKISFC